MKKVASIVAAALVTCSLTACGNRNTAYRTPGGTNQGGTNLSIDQRNNVGVGNVGYRDGVYLGEGDGSSKGNQAAIVTVRGGRITDVVLKTIDAKGREINTGNTTGSNTNTTTGINRNTTGGTNTNINGSTIRGTNTGTTNGGMSSGTTGGTNIGTNRSTTGTTGGTNVGTTLSNIDRVRMDLANAVVSQQTHNVNIGNVGNERSSVDNWKLAISRALDTARK